MRLVIYQRPPDMGGWGMLEELIWAGEGSSVHEGSGSPVAFIEPDRLYLPVARSQLPVGGLPEKPGHDCSDAFSELFRGLRGMRFYSLGLDELRQPKPRSAGALLGHHGEYLADIEDSP